MVQAFIGNDGNQYQVISNGEGGVNYFRIHSTRGMSFQQPIPRETFESQTGQNIGELETQAHNEWLSADNATNAPTPEEVSGPANTAPSNTGGTSGTPTDTWQPRTFMGQTYTDPESLAIAKRGYIDQLYREKLNEITSGLKRYLGSENANFENVGGELGETKTSFLSDVAKALENYNKSEVQDQGKIRGYYSGLGDIYQSSEGVRNADVANEYSGMRTDLDTQKAKGLTGLQRTFQDYVDQANTGKTNLYRNYMTALDEQQNASQGDLADVMGTGVGNQQLQITNPGVQQQTGGKSTSLLGSLQRTRDNVFRINRGNNSEQDILSYLYQGA